MNKALTAREVMRELRIRSDKTLRVWVRRGLIQPLRNTGGQGKALLFSLAAVTAAKVVQPRRGKLGFTKKLSPLRRPVALDAELLARVAWAFSCTQRSEKTSPWAATFHENLVNVADILAGRVPLDDSPDQLMREGAYRRANNNLPSLLQVPANVLQWARTCAGKLNAAEMRYVAAIFPAAWDSRRFAFNPSTAARNAWNTFSREVQRRAFPLHERRGGAVVVNRSFSDNAEDEVRRIYRTKRGKALGVGRARKMISAMFETMNEKGQGAPKSLKPFCTAVDSGDFTIENPLLVSEYAKQLSKARSRRGNFPTAGTVARTLGISRTHGYLLKKTVWRKLQRAGALSTLMAFFGQQGAKVTDEIAAGVCPACGGTITQEMDYCPNEDCKFNLYLAVELSRMAHAGNARRTATAYKDNGGFAPVLIRRRQ